MSWNFFSIDLLGSEARDFLWEEGKGHWTVNYIGIQSFINMLSYLLAQKYFVILFIFIGWFQTSFV